MKRAVVPVLMAAAVLAGCTSNTGGSGERSSSPTPTTRPTPTTATITLGGQKLTATLPPGAHFDSATARTMGAGCTIATADIDDGHGDGMAIMQLVPAGCERNGKPAMNGFLGLYATADDVASQGAEQRTVPAGKLATFNERYTECTNSCKNFGLDVAVVFLTHPADPQYPAINIIDTTSLDGTDNSGYSVADIATSLK